MSDKLRVELSPSEIQIEPGGSAVEAVVTLQNLGAVVEQYLVEVIGLDPEWFSAPVGSVGLFPQDTDQIRITFHPPKRQNLRAGSYPFQIKVRSRGGAQEELTSGTLAVRGFAVYRLDLTPFKQTGRGSGRFTVQLTNTGTGDTRVSLEARDSEEACAIRFPKDDTPLVPAGSKTELPLVITPKSRPLVGPERRYDFTVTARPKDSRGEAKTAPGQFTYRPLFASLAWVRRAIVYLVIVLGILVIANLVLASSFPGEFPRRVQIAKSEACGAIARVPLLGILCPGGPAPTIVADRNCTFDQGFSDFAKSDPQLIGDCTTRVSYDGFGNGIQYTTNGVLFWLKGSNTSYFYTKDSLYAYIDKKSRLLDGPGNR
jgi:hypothetical protein